MAKFLDNNGLNYLMSRIVELIDQSKQVDLISAIDEGSTNQQIPGAKAVYDLLTEALEGIAAIRMEVANALPPAGETNVVYLVQADADTYRQWIYTGGQWFDLGSAEIDLTGYWAKADLEALTNTEIQAVIDDALGV